MADKTDTRRAYEEAVAKLHAVARTYQVVPEANAELEAHAVEALKEAAVDFTHAERAAWEAGDFQDDPPTFIF
jgi:predicted phage-related endonuclease